MGPNFEIVKVTNKVSKILDDNGIEEFFYYPSRNFRARSLFVYNALNVTRHQAWIDNRGK